MIPKADSTYSNKFFSSFNISIISSIEKFPSSIKIPTTWSIYPSFFPNFPLTLGNNMFLFMILKIITLIIFFNQLLTLLRMKPNYLKDLISLVFFHKQLEVESNEVFIVEGISTIKVYIINIPLVQFQVMVLFFNLDPSTFTWDSFGAWMAFNFPPSLVIEDIILFY